jgi:predicted nucleotidyltransferase
LADGNVFLGKDLLPVHPFTHRSSFLMSVDTQDLLDRLRTLLDRPWVPFSVLHGSVAAGQDTPVSDVDVAVYVEDSGHFLDLVVALDETLPEHRVDVTNLARQPSWVVYRVLATGKTIHVADEELYHDVKFRAMRDYLDFKPVHDRILRDMERRLESGQYGRAVE